MTQKSHSKVIIFDIEADDLWYGITKVHCIWTVEAGTDDYRGFRPHQIEECLRYLETADVLVGHNVIDYDIPALQKVYPDFKPQAAFDTMTLGSMVASNRRAQTLDSWGKDLGVLKGTFGKTADWKNFSEEMFTYCKDDVVLTKTLYLHLCELAEFDPLNPPSMRL